MMDYEKIKLSNLSGGVADELFEREFTRVLENIADINTSGTKARSITITVTIKPTESRENGEVSIQAQSVLAPAIEHRDPIYFNRDGSDHVAFQAKKIIPQTLFDVPTLHKAKTGKGV